MKPTKQLIAISAPVAISAAVTEGDSKGPASFEVVAYTGGALTLGNFDAPVVVDLDGVSFGKSLIANLDHDRGKRVGHVTGREISDGQLVLSGKVSAATESAREVVGSAANGFVWQASIEAQPDELIEVAAGKTIEVNGQEFTGPLYVARKSTLKGFAFVSHGADDNTVVSIAASAASQRKEKTMRTEVQKWIKALLPSVDIDALSPDEVANIEADYDGRQGNRATATKTPENPFEKRKIEAKRRQEIEEIANRFMADRDYDIETISSIQAMHDHAIESGMEAKDFRSSLWESFLPVAATVSVPRCRQDSDPREFGNVLSAAVCIAGNLPNIEKHFSEQVLHAADTRFGQGIGLKQLYAEAAKFNGYKTNAYDVTLDMHRFACGLQNASPQIRASAFSTLSLPGILSNTAQKFLLEGWGGGDMAWQNVTAIRSVRDFKQVTSYKLSGNLKYLKIGASGELQHGTVAEGSYTNQADTYGRMFAVTRTDIINDDLGALTTIPRELGYGANDAFNEVFWTEFLSADDTFFDAGNNNVSAGTVTASTVIATLAAAELVFMAQTKPNGTPLGVMPDRVLMPNATYRVMLAAMASPLVVGSTGPTPNANTFAGNYQVYTTPYISNSLYTGYSAAKWYLLANPARLAVIETAFLNGRQAPVVETADASFNVLGVQMRGYHDFGVNLQEYRAGVQGTGA